jgi:hypothetical protein
MGQVEFSSVWIRRRSTYPRCDRWTWNPCSDAQCRSISFDVAGVLFGAWPPSLCHLVAGVRYFGPSAVCSFIISPSLPLWQQKKNIYKMATHSLVSAGSHNRSGISYSPRLHSTYSFPASREILKLAEIYFRPTVSIWGLRIKKKLLYNCFLQ